MEVVCLVAPAGHRRARVESGEIELRCSTHTVSGGGGDPFELGESESRCWISLVSSVGLPKVEKR